MCIDCPSKSSLGESDHIDFNHQVERVKSDQECESDYNSGSVFEPSDYEPRPFRDTTKITKNIHEAVPTPVTSIFDPETAGPAQKSTKNNQKGQKNQGIVVQHNYHDHGDETEADHQDQKSKPRGGVAVPFPLKLHVMLDEAMEEGYDDIVSWQPHGRAFVVHKPKEFQEIILPRYYKLSKLSSYQRQLNLYGFQRLTSGRDRGGYYHELFLRKKRFLTRDMQRVQVKGTGVRARSNPKEEPNFWAMKWCQPKAATVSSDDDTDYVSGFGHAVRHPSLAHLEEGCGPILPQSRRPSMTHSEGEYRSASRVSIVDSVCGYDTVGHARRPSMTHSEYDCATRRQSLSHYSPKEEENKVLLANTITALQMQLLRYNSNIPSNITIPEAQCPCHQDASQPFDDQDSILSFGNRTFHYLESDPFQPLSLDPTRNQRMSDEVGTTDYGDITNLFE